MLRELKYKRDFGLTIDRFEAWWHGEMLDRPPITLSVPPSRPYAGPASAHGTARERWMDVRYAVESAVASLETYDHLADSLPIYCPNLGPEITATLFGCELQFSETTSWSSPIVHEADDWQRVLNSPANFQNVYWRTIEQMTRYALEICDGRYLVGITDLHGNFDILAALRDPQMLCTDLIDCPQLVQRAARHAAHGYVDAFDRLRTILAAAGMGSTTWCPYYHVGAANIPSCDFWCMVSGEVARELVLPEVLYEMGSMQRTIFHLDGPQALRHLDLLLEIPHLNAVQWVYGAGNGPASKWVEVYRRIRRAGKSVQLLAQDAADALNVLGEIGPRGLWITVAEPFGSAALAQEFIRTIEGQVR